MHSINRLDALYPAVFQRKWIEEGWERVKWLISTNHINKNWHRRLSFQWGDILESGLNLSAGTLDFQYQYALVRVLTHFVAEPSDPGGEMVFMLGADWQADITHLVLDQLKVREEGVMFVSVLQKHQNWVWDLTQLVDRMWTVLWSDHKWNRCSPQVEDPRIARLIDGHILIGRDLGITTIQVHPLISDVICCVKFSNSSITLLIPLNGAKMSPHFAPLFIFSCGHKPLRLTCYTISHN